MNYALGFGASVYVVTDQVDVGGARVPHMSVDVATKVGTLAEYTPDGTLGLAFRKVSAGKTRSVDQDVNRSVRLIILSGV